MGLEVEALQALKAAQVSGLGQLGMFLAGHVISVKKCSGLFCEGVKCSASLADSAGTEVAMPLLHLAICGFGLTETTAWHIIAPPSSHLAKAPSFPTGQASRNETDIFPLSSSL